MQGELSVPIGRDLLVDAVSAAVRRLLWICLIISWFVKLAHPGKDGAALGIWRACNISFVWWCCLRASRTENDGRCLE